MRSLLCSRLFNNVGILPRIGRKEHAVMSAAYMKPLTDITGLWIDERHLQNTQHQRTSDDHVLKEANMPSASTIVMLARLRFFARLLTTPLHLAQFFAMAAYKAPGSWLSQVVGDLECLRVRMASRLSDMPRPEDDLKPWLQLIRSSTSTWERTLKLLDRYTERPAVPSLASPHTLLAEDGEFVCACGKTFNSQVLLNAHNVRYHGYRHLARYYMFDDHV